MVAEPNTLRFTIHASGAQSGRDISWGVENALTALASSRKDAQFTNIYKEAIFLKQLFGEVYSTVENPTTYRMLMDLRPSRGYAWTPGPRFMWLYSDFVEKSRLDFSFLPAGGLVLQPKEGFLLTFSNDTGQAPVFIVGMEAYRPRDIARIDWHDPASSWSPIFQQGATTPPAGGSGYLPVRSIGAVNYQDSLSNETDRPILVRALTMYNVPTAWGGTYQGFQLTLKVRRLGGKLTDLSAREILGGVSNYISPGLGVASVEENRLITLKKPYLMEPNETLAVTFGIASNYNYGDAASGDAE